jgi:hypothetical protein
LRLSEAIIIGASLRPEARERFCYIANLDTLGSDVWGAACEAVMPTVKEFNWNTKDQQKLDRALEALNAVQHHYFGNYWNMPTVCPGAKQSVTQQGGRIVTQNGHGYLKTYEEGAKVTVLGGITSECDKVTHLAGFVDHAFYRHNWTREQVAKAVEWYENTRSLGQFEHYQDAQVSRLIRQRLTEPLSAYPKIPRAVN